MEYTVILTRQPGAPWRASVPVLPDCAIEAPTRAKALEEIQKRILLVTNYSEVLRLQVPAAPKMADEQLLKASQTPWQWFGAFQDDPTWGSLFDEIERQRNGQLLGE